MIPDLSTLSLLGTDCIFDRQIGTKSYSTLKRFVIWWKHFSLVLMHRPIHGFSRQQVICSLSNFDNWIMNNVTSILDFCTCKVVCFFNMHEIILNTTKFSSRFDFSDCFLSNCRVKKTHHRLHGRDIWSFYLHFDKDQPPKYNVPKQKNLVETLTNKH